MISPWCRADGPVVLHGPYDRRLQLSRWGDLLGRHAACGRGCDGRDQLSRRPKSGWQVATLFSAVASAEVTDPATVTVKLKAPNVQFQYWAAHIAGFIFKKDQLKPADSGTPDGLPLGVDPTRSPNSPRHKESCWKHGRTNGAARQSSRRSRSPPFPMNRPAFLRCKRDINGTFVVSITNFRRGGKKWLCGP